MTMHDFARLVEELRSRAEARKLVARANPEQIEKLLQDIQVTPDAGFEAK